MQSNNKTYVLLWTLDVEVNSKYFITWLYTTKFALKANYKMIFYSKNI